MPGCDDLRRAIMQLPDEYREPLVMQVLGGLTTAEIAAELKLTQPAVLTRLFRARNRLRVDLRARSPRRTRNEHAGHRLPPRASAIGGDPHDLPPEVTAHLATCAACCRDSADETLALDGRLRAALELPLTKFRKSRAAPARRFALAASVVLAPLIGRRLLVLVARSRRWPAKSSST